VIVGYETILRALLGTIFSMIIPRLIDCLKNINITGLDGSGFQSQMKLTQAIISNGHV